MRTFTSSAVPPAAALGIAALLALLLSTPPVAAVDDFTLVVPRKPAPQLQVAQVSLTVQVDTESPIGFTITPPAGASQATPNLSPGPAPASTNLFFGTDLVQVTPPDTSGLGASDPRRRNYRIVLSLTSDFDGNCQTVMAADETWTVAVTGGADRIQDACSVSFDEDVAMNECNGAFRLVPNGEPFAEIGGIDSQAQTCRFGIDAMLVLDRSGSMGAKARPADPPGPGNTRMSSLQSAVEGFVDTLTDIRATETLNFGAAPTDNVGVVTFNQNAADLAGLGAGLNVFDPGNATALETGVDALTPSGSTSIGDGVFSADAHLGAPAANRRRVILLMSDGQQNNDRRLGADVGAGTVFTHPGGVVCPGDPSCQDLSQLGTFQIYTVTVGLGVGPAAEQLNQDVALATGGFYLNSEDDASALSEFFGGLLQNFLETATWQTVLSGFDGAAPEAPFTVDFPVTSTTQALIATLTPKEPGRGFCLRFRPPGGSPGAETCGSGVLTRRITPGLLERTLDGEWRVEVQARGAEQDFHLMVLADDLGVGARVVAESGSYAPGDPIRIEARITEVGQPITGLDPADLRVAVASPATTLGEILAESDAGTSPATPGDAAMDAANAKLQNLLEDDPGALEETTAGLSLRDDGTGGDRVAGDGVYSAEIVIEEYGNVDLVVTLRGSSERGGDFLRQKNQTVHLRTVPDGGRTEVTTQLAGDPPARSLQVTAVPRTRFGHLVGPGWANRFVAETATGERVKLRDELDGRYTGAIPFTGDEPPEIDVHVITDSVVITDDVPVEDLPLDDDTVLVPGVGGDGSEPGWSLSLHAGQNDPKGDVWTGCDGDLSWGVDLEYRFDSMWAAELFYGQENFDCGGGNDAEVEHLSLNGKAYFLSGTWRPFVGIGIGGYDFSPGSSEVGGNLFAGLQANLLPSFAVEGAARYHLVDAGGDDAKFLAYHLGLRFRF